MNRQDRKTLAEHALTIVNRLDELPLPQRFEVLAMALSFLNIEQARATQQIAPRDE